MKKNIKAVACALCALYGLSGLPLQAQEQKNLPPVNPFLIQNSVYPTVHYNPAQTDAITLPIWKGDSKIEPSQVQWLPGVTTIGTAERTYPDGEKTIVFSGGNRVGKIRITGGLMSMIDEVLIPGYEDKSISTTEIRTIVKEMQANKSDEKRYLQAGSPIIRWHQIPEY